MDIKTILHIGVGRCGNKIVDEIMNKDKRYTGLMVNSSLGDMLELDNFKNKRASAFVIPNADGSGRDRSVAKEYAKTNVQRFADEILRFNQYELFIVYLSMDGGTGSGATPMLIRAMRRVLPPQKKIMVVGVMPKISSSKISLENTLDCWNDLMQLKDEKMINSFRFVDNDKREWYDEVNQEVVSDLDRSFKLHTFDKDGIIDQRDSRNINTANGYGMFLNINNNIDDIKTAIEQAKKNSVFVMPHSNDCDYLGMLLQSGRYNLNEAKCLFNVYETDYVGNSDGRNIILATGMNIPVQKIELIQVALKEFKQRSNSRIQDASLFVSKDSEPKEETVAPTPTVAFKNVTTATADELDALFDDDCWN